MTSVPRLRRRVRKNVDAQTALVNAVKSPGRSGRHHDPRVARRGCLSFDVMEERVLLDGALDPFFQGSGIAAVPFESPVSEYSTNAVAVQLDGKIVVVGTVNIGTGGFHEIAVSRFNPDGSIDTSFGQNGTAYIGFGLGGTSGDFGDALAIDGTKIVVGGAATSTIGSECAVARLNADGSLDSSFGAGGKITLSITAPNLPDSEADAVAIQPDGKIVLAGRVQNAAGDTSDFGVARLNQNGQPDTTFNQTGQATTDLGGGGYNIASAIAIGPGGKIFVAGQTPAVPGKFGQMALVTYKPTGDLDGLEVIPTDTGSDSAVAVAATADGSVFVLGQDFDVAKLNQEGNFDLSFGESGVAYDVGGLSGVYATSLVVARDGNIYAAGGTSYGSDSQMVISRLLPSGSPDKSFGINGVTQVSFSSKATVFGLALEDDGRVVAAGTIENPLAASSATVVRLLGSDTSPPILRRPSNPTLDPTSDTGQLGDGITSVARPTFDGGGADPGRSIVLYDGSSTTSIGWATANANGTYSVAPLTPLSVGLHSISVAESDGQGYFGLRSGAFAVQITRQPISPTLVVITGGQQYRPGAKTAALAALSVVDSLLAPIFLGSLAIDVSEGIPLTGNGRDGGAPFQYDMATEFKNTLTTDLAGASTGARSLVVDWDTYGSVSAPAQSVAQQIQQIVSNISQFNGAVGHPINRLQPRRHFHQQCRTGPQYSQRPPHQLCRGDLARPNRLDGLGRRLPEFGPAGHRQGNRLRRWLFIPPRQDRRQRARSAVTEHTAPHRR